MKPFLLQFCLNFINVSLNHPFINLTLLLTFGKFPFLLNEPLSYQSRYFSGNPLKLSNPYNL